MRKSLARERDQPVDLHPTCIRPCTIRPTSARFLPQGSGRESAHENEGTTDDPDRCGERVFYKGCVPIHGEEEVDLPAMLSGRGVIEGPLGG